MKVTLVLADSAQVADGKLYILGGGWSITGPAPTTMAIAMLITVPWDATNQKHRWQLDLLDADGGAVMLPTPAGPQAVSINGEFEMGRPPGLPPGTPLQMPFAINFGSVPLPPGQRFVLQISIDGHPDPDWSVSFTTRAIAVADFQLPPPAT